MKYIVIKCLENYNIKTAGDLKVIRDIIRRKLRDYLFKKIKKNPMVLPIITEV